jgi:hypothetical protein
MRRFVTSDTGVAPNFSSCPRVFPANEGKNRLFQGFFTAQPAGMAEALKVVSVKTIYRTNNIN